MKIFARKHFSKNNAGIFILLINLAIYLRAGIAIAHRLVKQITVPLIDFTLITASLYCVRYFYETRYKFIYGGSFEEWMVNIAFPSYSLIWMLFIYLNGGYDKPIRLWKIFRGIVLGTAGILIIYSLLPEAFRFSRAMILFGSVVCSISYLFSRSTLHFLGLKNYRIGNEKSKRIGIIGNKDEFLRINELLKQTSVAPEFIGFISTENEIYSNENCIGNVAQISEIIQIHKLNEVIFCAKDLSTQDIISQMLNLVSSGVDFKIAPPESLSIIGSNNINTAGNDLYVIDFNSISKSNNKRKKRLLDIFICFALIIISPILIWKIKNKAGFLKNLVIVLFGAKTWVGYSSGLDYDLPKLKNSVLTPHQIMNSAEIDNSAIRKINLDYSKDYKIENDIRIIWKGVYLLGG